MQNLHTDFGAVFVYGAGNGAVPGHFGFCGELGAAFHHCALLVGADAAGDNQRHAAAGALGIKGGQMFGTFFMFFKSSVHGAHNHAVAQGVAVKGEGLRQQAGGGHECPL